MGVSVFHANHLYENVYTEDCHLRERKRRFNRGGKDAPFRWGVSEIGHQRDAVIFEVPPPVWG
jgi:hypothetical protein